MTTLVLGVIEVPYENEGKDAPKGKKRRRGEGSARGKPTTTVDVANFLEEKYGVMAVFYEQYKDSIGNAVVHSLEGALEDIFLGSPNTDPFAEAGQEIASGFREFLLSAQIEELGVPGVPTQASIERRSLRFKDKVSAGPRPSFISTGTYELSMRAWIE